MTYDHVGMEFKCETNIRMNELGSNFFIHFGHLFVFFMVGAHWRCSDEMNEPGIGYTYIRHDNVCRAVVYRWQKAFHCEFYVPQANNHILINRIDRIIVSCTTIPSIRFNSNASNFANVEYCKVPRQKYAIDSTVPHNTADKMLCVAFWTQTPNNFVSHLLQRCTVPLVSLQIWILHR